MDDAKLCPLLAAGLNAGSYNLHSVLPPAEGSEVIACKRERCAWWVKWQKHVGVDKWESTGDCGIALMMER